MIDFKQMVQDVSDGIENPYKALFELKQAQKDLKECIGIVEGISLEESIHEDKTFEKNGFKIEKRNGKKNWDFKSCKSFQIASSNLEEIKGQLKANFSQFEMGKQVVDENGEIGEVPKVTYSKDSLIVKKL